MSLQRFLCLHRQRRDSLRTSFHRVPYPLRRPKRAMGSRPQNLTIRHGDERASWQICHSVQFLSIMSASRKHLACGTLRARLSVVSERRFVVKESNESQQPNMLPARAALDTWVSDEWKDGV